VLKQSVLMTHQASPVCCGPPHTAGQSNLVHFFSGRAFEDGAGVAAGVGGLNIYGSPCSDTSILGKCHHALSQMVPGHIPAHVFHGTAFYQQSLVAHEIGHNANQPDLRGSPVCWLFEEQCGRSLAVTEGAVSAPGLGCQDYPPCQERTAGLPKEEAS
jgi:hypothetical protein